MPRRCLQIPDQQEVTRPFRNSIGPTPIVLCSTVLPGCTTFASTITVMYSSYTVHIKLTTMAKMPQSGPAWPRVAHTNQGDPETNFKSILDQTCSLTNFSPPRVCILSTICLFVTIWRSALVSGGGSANIYFCL